MLTLTYIAPPELQDSSQVKFVHAFADVLWKSADPLRIVDALRHVSAKLPALDSRVGALVPLGWHSDWELGTESAYAASATAASPHKAPRRLA